MPVIDVPRRKNNTPVSISANMELLVSKAISQNFVPVIDDSETFIGMVKRRTIVEYCYEKMKNQKNPYKISFYIPTHILTVII